MIAESVRAFDTGTIEAVIAEERSRLLEKARLAVQVLRRGILEDRPHTWAVERALKLGITPEEFGSSPSEIITFNEKCASVRIAFTALLDELDTKPEHFRKIIVIAGNFHLNPVEVIGRARFERLAITEATKELTDAWACFNERLATGDAWDAGNALQTCLRALKNYQDFFRRYEISHANTFKPWELRIPDDMSKVARAIVTLGSNEALKGGVYYLEQRYFSAVQNWGDTVVELKPTLSQISKPALLKTAYEFRARRILTVLRCLHKGEEASQVVTRDREDDIPRWIVCNPYAAVAEFNEGLTKGDVTLATLDTNPGKMALLWKHLFLSAAHTYAEFAQNTTNATDRDRYNDDVRRYYKHAQSL